MSLETQFIRKAGATPSGTDTLPSDITDVVLKRIVILCLISAGMAIFGVVMTLGQLLSMTVVLKGGYSAVDFATDAMMIVVALGIAWIVHRRKMSPRKLVALGLSFGVYSAFNTSVTECLMLVTDQFTPLAYFSFNQAWVVFFPALVPIRSWSTYTMIFLAAAMGPLSRVLIQSLGYVELPADSLTILTLVMMFSAIMGLVVSHVVYRMGKSVTAAREMGSYTLEASLGGGGMGEVWTANHRMLARPAAVKLIKTETLRGMSPADIEKLNHRFEHEVQATAALSSPHTVDIYDYGLAQNGSFYYVMERLNGIDMETLVERFGPVEPARVLFLLIQACHSLSEAHNRSLIHRDVKPANLFVCRYGDDFDFVKVLDFGLVKEVSAQSANEHNLTQPDLVMGTPDFMPPEMALGEKQIDGRADLYALGCVAYWLLSGTRLFTADSPMQALIKHINDPPVAPSKRSELTIPPELDALVLQCLEKDPNKRPNGAEELSAELQEIPLDHRWSREDARRWWETHQPA